MPPEGRRFSADALTAEEFQRVTNVSRETLDRLGAHLDLLVRWQSRINLVGKSTLIDPWRRHYLDSAQLAPLIGEDAKVVTDLGSGGGFPGLVLAILRDIETHLIESDERKCAFLRESVRVTRAPVVIHAGRIESMAPWVSDIVTARALAPISELLKLGWPFLTRSRSPERAGLFLKSENCETELTAASKEWKMRIDSRPSITDPRGRVIVIRDLTPEVDANGSRCDKH
jgi:16S rRNA (guanine527-N7)-methyltransferase